MPPQPVALANAIEQLIEFLTAFGDSEHSRIAPFRNFADRVQREPLAKELFREINTFKDEVFIQAREQIWSGRTIPGKDQTQTEQELQKRTGALFNAMHPVEPEPPDVDLTDFSGSEHVQHKKVFCRGNPAGARDVIERTIDLIQRYSQTLGRGDLQAAYAMTDAGLRTLMSYEKFVNMHQEAERTYHGPALQYLIERFAYVLTDQSARQESNTSKEGWPKATAKDNRRSRVIGFWIRDTATQAGCRGSIWISEEAGEYRVTKFDFYDD
jgi:hypothetical protein